MLSQNDALVAAAYAPCEAKTIVRGVPVHVMEETQYPFRNRIELTVRPESAVDFPLQLRIPAWAQGTSIKVNGRAEASPTAGTFATVERKWVAGDRVVIEFPFEPRASKWFNDSVAVERGSIVFSYSIAEDWVKLRDRGMTADWQVFPAGQWNYALAVNPEDVKGNFTVVETEVTSLPFSSKKPPVKLKAKARKLPDWRSEDGVANPVPKSPVTSNESEEEIELVPYGAAKLRITAFPYLKA